MSGLSFTFDPRRELSRHGMSGLWKLLTGLRLRYGAALAHVQGFLIGLGWWTSREGRFLRAFCTEECVEGRFA